jgi:hypothetical protein
MLLNFWGREGHHGATVAADRADVLGQWRLSDLSARGARSPYTAWLCGIERTGRLLARMCRVLNLAEKRSSRTNSRGVR